jgi:hypothetical protein
MLVKAGKIYQGFKPNAGLLELTLEQFAFVSGKVRPCRED